MAGEQEGCLGCGCAGCLPALGTILFVSVGAYFVTILVGVLAAVILVAGVFLLARAGWDRLAIYNQCTTLTNSHNRKRPQENNDMGKSTTSPINQIKSWTAEDLADMPADVQAQILELQQNLITGLSDEEFLRFTRAFPIRGLFKQRGSTSDIRAMITAVDHHWSGIAGERAHVIVSYEERLSGHVFHCSAKAFAEGWIYDEEMN